MALNVTTEAALAGAYPAVHLGKREQKIVKILKTYIDAASGESLAAASMSIGDADGLAQDVLLSSAGASRVIARVLSATFTVTIAAPGVFTATAHGLLNGDAVVLSTTGALPTGLAAATTYYVVSKTDNTFELSATSNGSSITTSGSQSGTHTFSASGLAPRALSIGNQDLAAAAAISFSKLATLSSGNLLVGSAGGVATSVAMSGDATIVASGALTIANSAITNAKVSGSAAIDYSKMATMTGDVTMSANVSAIGASKVLSTMISSSDGAVKLARASVLYSDLNTATTGVAFLTGPTIPNNAIIKQVYYEVLTTFVDNGTAGNADSATIKLGIEDQDNDELAAVAISDGGNPFDAGIHAGISVGTAATMLKLSAARQLAVTWTAGTGDSTALTAGSMDVFIEYVVGQ